MAQNPRDKHAPELALALRIRRTESLASLVRKELERMIVSGELKGGDRLNENALAERLGVSRGPIREACRGLEQSRLVEVVVNRGAYVRQINLQDALDIYDVRSALFGMAGELLAARITPPQLARVTDLVDRMDRAANDIDAYYPLNVEFHASLVDFAGNARLTATYHSLAQELHLFRRRGFVVEGSMVESNREHRQIVKALAARDAARAGALMRGHIKAGKARLINLIEAEKKNPAAPEAAAAQRRPKRKATAS